jgi:hypothetical protein
MVEALAEVQSPSKQLDTKMSAAEELVLAVR